MWPDAAESILQLEWISGIILMYQLVAATTPIEVVEIQGKFIRILFGFMC
jgi:hypothetical protein